MNPLEWTIYAPDTGAIISGGRSSPDAMVEASAQNNWVYVEGIYEGATHYVDLAEKIAKARPSFGFGDQTLVLGQTLTLTMPVTPTQVSVDGGVEHAVTDGTLTLTPDTAGVFKLAFSAFPYLDETITVTVNAA